MTWDGSDFFNLREEARAVATSHFSSQGFKGKTGHPGLPGPKVRKGPVTSAKWVFSAVPKA